MEQVRRNSKKRDAIYNVIAHTNTHPSAEWIFEQLHNDGISLATVYRNISYFCEEGTLKKVAVVNGKERYDATVEGHPHFVCRNCNGVFDVEILEESIKPDVLKSPEYVVESYDILFEGLCPECAKK